MKNRQHIQTVLSVAAIAVAAAALIRTGPVALDGASTAVAAPPPARFSAGEDRAEMIAELREINLRLARLESALASGLTVRVIEPEETDE